MQRVAAFANACQRRLIDVPVARAAVLGHEADPHRTFTRIELLEQADCVRAAVSDSVADTVDYKQVAKRVLAYVEGSKFMLIEVLAHRLALMLLKEFSFEWVKIDLNKPGAIRHSRDVGVSLMRRRADLSAGE